MKKFIALICVAVLFCSTTAFAATSPSAQAVVASTVAAPEGFTNTSDAAAAAARGMSAGEYYNNAVTTTQGITNAMPVGQGGKILINGVATNLTAILSKVNKTTVESAKSQAAALAGKLLNVVNISFPGANYKVATINFYVKGLEAGKKVVAKQLVNGEWIDLEVVEVRADHVVLNVTNTGAVAFFEMP